MRCIPKPRPPAILSKRRRPTICSSSKTINPLCVKISPNYNWSLFPPQHITTDKGHGRIELRQIWASTELKDYIDFPHAAQVFAIQRETTEIISQKFRSETVYGITSMTAERANPERILALSRNHWSIENRLHWVRDVIFDQDRSRIRRGAGAQI